ncbi:MAG: FG-GAP-like repeat-containing protein [Phycisphaerales bacterium]
MPLSLCTVCCLCLLTQPEPNEIVPSNSIRVLWRVPLQSVSFGSAAIADADGDGGLDVAFATYFNDSRVYVLRGTDGTELWQHNAGKACLDASCRFADLDGDRRLELVVPVSNRSEVISFDAASGKVHWTMRLAIGECIDTPPWIGEIEGKSRIVVGTFKGNVHFIDGLNGDVTRTLHAAPGAVQSCPIVTDLSGDGEPDVVVGNFRGDHSLHAVDGKTGEEMWAFKTGSHIYHGPSLGDLDGDGEPELVVGSYDGRVYAVRGRDGSELWNADAGDRYIMSPTVITDVNGDGKPEVVAASEHVTVYRADGSTLWSEPVAADPGAYDSVTRGVAVADLDGDGTPDLAYLTSEGVFIARRATDGRITYRLDVAEALKLPAQNGSHCPTIADLDGDGKYEVFVVVGNPGNSGEGAIGEAACLTGFSGGGTGWREMRHDAQNTGNTRGR